MQFFHRGPNGERGALRHAAILWLLGVPGIAALLIGFLVCGR